MVFLQIDERYTLLDLVESTKYISLWSAMDNKLHRRVMIKTIPPDDGKPVEEMVRKEAILYAKMTHPNILPVYDFQTEENDYPYIVVPYIPFRLNDLLESDAINISFALRLAQQLAGTIDYIHENAITHFDFTPKSVFLSEDYLPYLADFDTSLYGQNIKDGMVVGTPAYIAPEVASGKVSYAEHNPMVDIYMFGIVLFEMFTGELPFDGDDINALLTQHVNETLPSCRSISPELPIGLDIVLKKMCAKNPVD
ncbi:MAG: serine/threonine-protein kinase, partial [Chloroflexota bacterium]